MNTRAKFICGSVKKYLNWNPGQGTRFVYNYEFSAVVGNTPENESFFASTPSGSLTLSAVRNDLFEPGKSYYLDFSPAEEGK